MRRFRVWGLAAFLVLTGAHGYPQAPPATVVAIEVQPGPGRQSADYLHWVAQAAQKPLDRTAVRTSIEALFATGDFEDVKAVAYPATGGVRLVFETTPAAFVSLVRVLHAPEPPTESELEDASGLELGQTYAPSMLPDAAAKIAARLRGYGYYQARVTPSMALDAASGRAQLQFDVLAGPKALAGRIEFDGTLLSSPGQLLSLSHLISGHAISRSSLDDALRRLQAYYGSLGHLTASVALAQQTYNPATNRLDIEFQIQPGPIVSVVVDGMTLSSGTVRKYVPVFQEHAADFALVEEGRRNLVDYLQGQGYFEATVEDQESPATAGAVRIVYTIQPGPKESLESIRFAGNHYFSDYDLAERLAIRTSSTLPDWIPGARGRFSDLLLQDDVGAVQALYRGNGFNAVKVTTAVDRKFGGNAGHIQVVFTTVEGPQTLVGQIHLAGLEPAQSDAVRQLLNLAPGQPFDPPAVASDREAILTYLYNSGYQAASCDATTAAAAGSSDAAPRMDVTFTATPGQRQTVHNVFIAGDQFVHRNVIQHDLHFGPGQPLSQLAMLQSQRDLYDSGLFTDVNVMPKNPAGTDSSKDVLVTVSEARRYTFSEGVGLQIQGGTGGAAQNVLGSTGYSPLFAFDVTRTAFAGRDQTISLKSTYGTLAKRAVLGYDIPDFLNHPALKADLTTYYEDAYDVRTYRALRAQTGLQVEEQLGAGTGLTYSVDYLHVAVLSPLVAPEDIPILSQPDQVAEAVIDYHRDHRDDPLDSHTGTYNNLQFGVARSFGGFADFDRLLYQNNGYHRLGPHGRYVFARSTQVGFEIPYGPQQLLTTVDPTGASITSLQHVIPLPERFLSGGANSLRGFSINQAGPRDPITGFPVGGNALFVNNLEFRFPLLGQNIGGVAFYDLGNVYSTPRELLQSLGRWKPPSLNDLDFTAHTVGLGLRYKTPIGPVSLDSAYLLNPPLFEYFTPTPVVQRLPAFHFFFSIGQTF